LAPLGKDLMRNEVAIIGIDIPLLAYKFKQWSIVNDEQPTLYKESIEQFISKQILPFMLDDQVDIVVRNRLRYLGESNKVPKIDIPCRSMADFTISVDKLLTNAISEVNNNTRLSHLEVLDSIPFIHSKSYLTGVPIVETGLDPLSYWAIVVLYTEWLYPMTVFLKTDISAMGNFKHLLTAVKRYFTTINAHSAIPKPLVKAFDTKLLNVEKKYL
jgi:hypothetical protein